MCVSIFPELFTAIYCLMLSQSPTASARFHQLTCPVHGFPRAVILRPFPVASDCHGSRVGGSFGCNVRFPIARRSGWHRDSDNRGRVSWRGNGLEMVGESRRYSENIGISPLDSAGLAGLGSVSWTRLEHVCGFPAFCLVRNSLNISKIFYIFLYISLFIYIYM